MIYTDIQPGEPDILTPVRHQTLRVLDLGGIEITRIPAPQAGWTHEALETVCYPLERRCRADGYDGLDFKLGDQCIGSTEC